MTRLLLIALGTCSLGIGITGIFIPGLPTTPFILLTAGLYMRSSPRLYNRLLENKILGNYIKDFHRNKGMTLRAKIYSISIMWLMILVSVSFFIESPAFKIMLAAIGIAGSVVMGMLIPTARK